MKIIRYLDTNSTVCFARLNPDGSAEKLAGSPFSALSATGQPADLKKLLAPIVPPAILCIGLNYKHHAAESGMKEPEIPILFVKGTNALQNPGDPILLPTHLPSEKVDYECELAVVIGKACKNVKRAEALDYVLGLYLCQRCQRTGLAAGKRRRPMVQGEILRYFAPLGPCIVTSDEITNPIPWESEPS